MSWSLVIVMVSDDMRHLKKGRKFGRTRDQRRAFLRSLLSQLIGRGRIRTTEARAKEIRPLADKMITMAKNGTLPSRRILSSRLPNQTAAKLMKEIAPAMAERKGGYTRIIKIGPRKSDGARMAIIEFVK